VLVDALGHDFVAGGVGMDLVVFEFGVVYDAA